MSADLINYGFNSVIIRNGIKQLNILSLLLYLSVLYVSAGYTQSQISGVINQYAAVDSIWGDQAVILSDTDHPFQPGDTALLIQMKGMSVFTHDDIEEFGRQQDMNNSGNYEFLLIDQVNNDTIIFTREFLKEYNAIETAQLVRVRGYESARVTGTLEPEPWNPETGTGGVLAIIVTNTLTLEADIDATARGFRGGTPTLSDNECGASDPDTYSKLFFPGGSGKAGKKGEGPVTYYYSDPEDEEPDPDLLDEYFIHGFGRMATGGGGGNGLFAGGGGGSNYGFGGYGGNESEDCPEFLVDGQGLGGIRGSSISDNLLDEQGFFRNRFYMGGGGGGSTEFGDRKASPGGHGGGIAIILANYIESTEDFGIYADGGSVTVAATAGAGGGGGGGTIVASIDNFIGNLNLYARGGDGGDVDYETMAGPGGGGGGGTIIHPGTSLSPNINPVLDQGASGTNLQQNNDHGTTIAVTGGVIGELELSLNGLLFNGIRTERETICEDTAPDILEGTQPRGGERPYVYIWLRRESGSTEWETIAGADEQHYQPGLLTQATEFLRVVKDDDDDDPVIDSSNVITITVQPKITGNTISGGQLICEGETPSTLTGPEPEQGGTGIFEYKWYKHNEAGQEWMEADNENEGINYSPPPLLDSTSFTRIALSGVCVDTSNRVNVDVHPAITNNILDDDQTMCHGDTPQAVSAPGQPGGGLGAGTYSFNWESTTNEEWSQIDENGDTAGYTPGSLTATTRYRRTVESGVCLDRSPPHTIAVLPLITNNSISADQTICYMYAPGLFEGSEPGGGDGNYRYLWEYSSNNDPWSAEADDNESRDFLSPGLSDTTYFRRVVYSGINDACKDTSNTVKVDFYPVAYAEIIETSDTICLGEQSAIRFSLRGESPWDLVFTDGQENYSREGINNTTYTTDVSPEAQDSMTYSYHIVSMTDRFGCSAVDEHLTGAASVRVYAYPEPDAGTGGEICGQVFDLNATPSFGRALWEISSAAAQFSPDPASPDAVITVEEYGTHGISWTETNWQCQASEEISVTFYEQPVEVSAGDDQDLQYLFESRMEAELPETMEAAYGVWQLVEGRGNIIFPEDPGTLVTDMSFGHNIFLWTIYNGVCEPVSDQVTIMIRDLDAPTGFSPNNSGFNDRFVIKGLENSTHNELTIFNRQGNVVYRAVNYRNDWEGRNQSGAPLPEDTYYYILSVDDQYSYKGFIVLKR